MKTVKIRTSDRSTFRRCRRKFSLASSIGQNLQSNTPRGPLWLGSGFHYALEDFHGHNKYKSPVEALKAYAEAFRMSGTEVPDDVNELMVLGEGMLAHYLNWLDRRSNLETYWLNGEPQVEVKFEIPIDVDLDIINKNREYEDQIGEVIYSGTIDRICIDEDDHLWLVDYKTAKAFLTAHFELDPQISAYMWGATQVFEKPIAGFIYQQHKKTLIKEPATLRNGTISAAANQAVTHFAYEQALKSLYGTIDRAPAGNLKILEELLRSETEHADLAIRRDFVFRSAKQIESESVKILAETYEMLDPTLAVYSNPTRDCSWDCDFSLPCLLMDTQDDYKRELKASTQKRASTNELEIWRNFI